MVELDPRNPLEQGKSIPSESYQLVLTILPQDRLDRLDAFYPPVEEVAWFQMNARGTAHSSILDLLGLQDSPMRLTAVCVRSQDVESYLLYLRKNLELHAPGNGISIALPIERSLGLLTLFAVADRFQETQTPLLQKSVFRHLPFRKSKAAAQPSIEAEPHDLQADSHDLILSILNEGHADAAMEFLRQHKVRGGTILEAAGRGAHDDTQWFGEALIPEKEILLTVVEKHQTHFLLDWLEEQAALDQPGQGIAFALPVHYAVGLAKWSAEETRFCDTETEA